MNINCNLFLSWQIWIFSIITQCSVSHDPNLLLKKHFLLSSMLNTFVLLCIFVETVIQFVKVLIYPFF